MTTQQKILDFMSQHTECVLVTTGEDGSPQAATVGFSETLHLELTIGTTKSSRKYQNIMRDPRVAVVVGFEGNATVQYEGTARELTGDELAERQKLHFQKIPGAQRFNGESDQTYLSISPTWVRYTNYTQPKPVEELRQFA
ncbi:MAG TPA: pyridoxamine 5'-phosphate oxidase family protein [Candidatus Saccharimonadales bacterium]|jgi:general stress protein 26